jgi:TPR repeat protein
LMYKNGDGIPHDYKKAIKWWTKAADQGHASAQYNLGLWMRKHN